MHSPRDKAKLYVRHESPALPATKASLYMCKELRHETSALERESTPTHRSVFGFRLGFACVGVDDSEVESVDAADHHTEAVDDAMTNDSGPT